MKTTTARGETRQRLIDAATRAFVAKSYNAVGLQEILNAAGVPKGSFYHYFRSKEELGLSIIEACADEHMDRERRTLSDRSRPPLQRLRKLFEGCRDHYAEHGLSRECVVAKLGMEVSQASEPMRAAVKCAFDQWKSLVAQCLREAQVAGEVDPRHDPETLADFINNAWEGAAGRMQIDRSIEPIDQCLHYLFEVLLPHRSAV